jgi:ABC-type transport system substrate-binding protein
LKEALDDIDKEKNPGKKIILFKKIQELLHQNEPVTFLYWLDVKTAYNKRIDKITIDPLGAIQLCWEWRLRD